MLSIADKSHFTGISMERIVHDWADWALKAILVGIVALSVSYLKSMSDHIQSVDITITEMKGDLKELGSNQNNFNKTVDRLELRMLSLEGKPVKKRVVDE